jgi:hypothetical protein
MKLAPARGPLNKALPELPSASAMSIMPESRMDKILCLRNAGARRQGAAVEAKAFKLGDKFLCHMPTIENRWDQGASLKRRERGAAFKQRTNLIIFVLNFETKFINSFEFLNFEF